jgi:hypothetical protein
MLNLEVILFLKLLNYICNALKNASLLLWISNPFYGPDSFSFSIDKVLRKFLKTSLIVDFAFKGSLQYSRAVYSNFIAIIYVYE